MLGERLVKAWRARLLAAAVRYWHEVSKRPNTGAILASQAWCAVGAVACRGHHFVDVTLPTTGSFATERKLAMNIISICGSLRKGSYNRILMNALPGLAPAGMSLKEAPSFAEFPLYNADIKNSSGFPATVGTMADAIRSADGVIFCTPEYNFSIPGVLKNAIDWLSRPPHDAKLKGKPVAILGAGGRLGSARAQYHLRQVCGCLGMLPVPRPEIFVLNAWERFDADGRLTDQAVIRQLGELLAALDDWARLLKRST